MGGKKSNLSSKVEANTKGAANHEGAVKQEVKGADSCPEQVEFTRVQVRDGQIGLAGTGSGRASKHEDHRQGDESEQLQTYLIHNGSTLLNSRLLVRRFAQGAQGQHDVPTGR